MKAEFDNMEIQKITFETGDSDVLVNTNITQGNLSYETQFIVGHTELNILINKIQKQCSDEMEISSLFESEKMFNGNLLYTLDFVKKLNKTIHLTSFRFDNNIKQIRA